jgi:hypothetical protein
VNKMAQPGLLSESESQQPQSGLLPVPDNAEYGLLSALGLGEVTRRKFLQGAASVAIPKFPFQSILKGVDLSSSSIGDLYKLQSRIKKLMVQYLGSTVGGGPGVPGGFEGSRHAADKVGGNAEKASRRYWERLSQEYEDVNEVLSKKSGVWTNVKPDHTGRHPDRPRDSILLKYELTKDVSPFDKRDPHPNFKSWAVLQNEVRDDLLEQEKITGRTLVTRRGLPIGTPIPGTAPRLKDVERTNRPESSDTERKPQPRQVDRPLSDSPRLTRTASPPVQFPSGRDISRMALRGATTAAGWPLALASFGIPTARSGESQMLAELADQPDADVEAAIRYYRQRAAQEQQESAIRREQAAGLLMSGMP